MPHTPRYYFGFGLSYTTFEYSGLKIDNKAVNPNEQISIEMTLKNTGSRAGDEIVQLYFRDCYASTTRPVKELAGFKRVTLEPGEEKRVRFLMKASQTAFLDRNMKWKVEKENLRFRSGALQKKYIFAILSALQRRHGLMEEIGDFVRRA